MHDVQRASLAKVPAAHFGSSQCGCATYIDCQLAGAWGDTNLKACIKDPQAKVKGNRRPFGGLNDDKDIDGVIAYLKDYK